MTYLTKLLDTLTGICVVLLFSKYFVSYANMVFDWNLRWYLLENIPNLPIILFILMFVSGVSSEMIKDRQKKKNIKYKE
ncbi:TPA: hypothetical protein ACGI1V_000176 [Staphylococcus argenteus]|uniref:epilancin biosynthesis-related protein ElxI1 n=1 Tax=Staphylococcus argenteus TaxID=985002 RepID=UPI0004494646|nr:hypothetical protein [Staphylococcus argenteus]BBN29950.1 hypothetical protein KUH140087_0797 [Staphylococcus aureus]ATY56757.1 hypothetical protein CJ017_05650 [Staphylococcus argenteus]ATZ86980.1 hypothetical protein CKO49_05675 [Staphylococcus argenteus]EKF1503492.1 hypothetical protein [Staphylococcus argenteus]EYG90942.1 hypothetical protein V676_01545 [Staphylococcus argenteus]